MEVGRLQLKKTKWSITKKLSLFSPIYLYYSKFVCKTFVETEQKFHDIQDIYEKFQDFFPFFHVCW